ncbi:MAG: hypothetical protein HHJ09_12660 [Glaciimonas sp.]|nr:hypothetical protein [Glaciimonas sp.]
MKNPHVERLKRRAKQRHRARRGDHFEGGIMCFHHYDRLLADRLTWWDDVTFVLNNYRVALAWTHPRMAYEDAIDAEADRLTADLPSDNFMRDGTPVYRTVGRSRKQIIHTVYEPCTQTDRHDQWQQARKQVMLSANIQIGPSLDAHWCQYSRVINLCVPIEVRNESDLRQLVALTRRLLMREVTLQEAFPDYQYTRADWEREGLHIAGSDLHVHKVGL